MSQSAYHRKYNHMPSDRELEVWELVAKGLTNEEIGKELHISVRTVQTHLVVICEKMGFRNRTEAAAAWVKRRIAAELRKRGMTDVSWIQ
ncbi:MAG: helix-turn-helix transcriptional regulator [bacterium]|nr:helix-turn-helix transcriptional regulator [bacterium]